MAGERTVRDRTVGTSRLAAIVVVVAVIMAVGMVPAAAAGAKAVGGMPGEGETHCVVSVVAIAPDGEMKLRENACFGTYSEALSYASSGLHIPADTPGTALNHSGFRRTMGGLSTLAQHFDGFRGTGSSIIIKGYSCSGYWNTSSYWANRISSTYNVCYKTRHYDLPYMGGMSITFYGVLTLFNMSWAMNNETQSVRYYAY